MAPPPHPAPRSRRRRRLVSGLVLVMLLLAVVTWIRSRGPIPAERVGVTLELVETAGYAWTVELQAAAPPLTRQVWHVPAGATVSVEIPSGSYVARQSLLAADVSRRQEVEFSPGTTYRWSLAAVAPSVIWPPRSSEQEQPMP